MVYQSLIEKMRKIAVLNYLSAFLFAFSIAGLGLHFVLQVIIKDGQGPTLPQVSYGIYLISILLAAWFVSREFHLTYLLKSIGIYALYLLTSYFLTITKNLNNGEFNILAFKANGFFQTKFLPTLLLILSLGIGVHYGRRLLPDRFRSSKEPHQEWTFTLYGFTALFILTNTFSDEIFLRLYGAHQVIDRPALMELLPQLISLLMVYGILSYFLIEGLGDLFTNKPTFSVMVLFSFYFGIFFNYVLQYGLKRDQALMEMFVFPAAMVYQILCIFIFSLLVYLLINRFLLASMIIVSFWTSIGVINAVKMNMRNEPMLFTDFSWIKQIGLVSEFVDAKIILSILAGLAIAAIVYLLLRKRLLPGKMMLNIKQRIALVVVIVSFVATIFNIFNKEEDRMIRDGVPVISQLNNNYNVFWMGLSYHARYRSLLFIWTKQITSEIVLKPDDYSKQRMVEIFDKYEGIAKDINKERTEKLSDQTVIFLLSESFANPERLDGITVSQDIMPHIRQLMAANTSGTMQSDAYGGGTANMEWQSLVGLPMYNMSESISTINTEVVPKMEIIPAVSDLYSQKNRIAVHLGDGATYSRNILYQDKLKFGKFITTKNGTHTMEEFYRLGLFPSDDSTYQTVLSEIDTDQNQFFSVITYQNHIPYRQGKPEHITATGEKLNQEETDSLNSYVRLMYQTDIETKKFLDSLSQMDKKITVVFYGDHLPGFYPESQFEEAPNSQYQTDYFIWSNYQTVKKDYSYVNSSDFPAAVLAHTNSKVSPYYALLTKVLEEASVNEAGLADDQLEIADDLKLVEYDLTSGRGYLNKMKGFFELAQ